MGKKRPFTHEEAYPGCDGSKKEEGSTQTAHLGGKQKNSLKNVLEKGRVARYAVSGKGIGAEKASGENE